MLRKELKEAVEKWIATYLTEEDVKAMCNTPEEYQECRKYGIECFKEMFRTLKPY